MAAPLLALPGVASRLCVRQDWAQATLLAGRAWGSGTTPLRHTAPAPCFSEPTISCTCTCSPASAGTASTSQLEPCFYLGKARGRPGPLGVHFERDGSVNFALFSRNADKVVLCLYQSDSMEPALEILLEPAIHRTGDVWHVQLESLKDYSGYGYRCMGDSSWEAGNRFHPGSVLLDPYAKHLAPLVSGRGSFAIGLLSNQMIPFFDWEEDIPPRIPLHKMVGYKMNVHGFTIDVCSKVEESLRGSFLGVIEKADHLLRLGVNAVILQPIFAHDESDGSYYPLSFFAPSPSYGIRGDSISASTSLKQMVKELHRKGIEVILEVVYSHTAENGDDRPKPTSFRGIDNATYYILDQFDAMSMSDMGAENSVNCNHPVVTRLILDSLRHWVEEYHVDGFCFVHASALITGPHGQELSRPPLVESISFDPVLASTKLIADLSSPISGVHKDITFPHWQRWCEWNFHFRDDVRRMIRGEQGLLSSFATRLCGSGDIFSSGRSPSFSLNFVTSPYGLTLADLVSYSDTGEKGDELSWNCGCEGPTSDQSVLYTRVKQVGNFLMALFLSQGVPVLNMGDEYGHSKGGSTFVEDRASCFQWDALEADFGQQMTLLISSLVAFRSRRKDLLQQKDFLKVESLSWHGLEPNQPQWEVSESCFIAASLHVTKPPVDVPCAFGDLYIAFNARSSRASATLPDPQDGMAWYRIADTSLPFPQNFIPDGVAPSAAGFAASFAGSYDVQPYSSVLLEARAVEELEARLLL